MSRSGLWVMNEKLEGEELVEFWNPHLLSPVVYEMMYQKYLSNEKKGSKEYFITATMVDVTVDSRLNQKVNLFGTQEDRIVWEFVRHQVFFTKDKVVVADALKNFLTMNKILAENFGTHIHERFQEVANAILVLNAKTNPYFIFETSNVENVVLNWFQGYDEEEDDCFPRTLKDVEENVTEFVIFENNQLEGFVPNTDFSYKLNQL